MTFTQRWVEPVGGCEDQVYSEQRLRSAQYPALFIIVTKISAKVLHDVSCDCYARIERQCEELLGPLADILSLYGTIEPYAGSPLGKSVC